MREPYKKLRPSNKKLLSTQSKNEFVLPDITLQIVETVTFPIQESENMPISKLLAFAVLRNIRGFLVISWQNSAIKGRKRFTKIR